MKLIPALVFFFLTAAQKGTALGPCTIASSVTATEGWMQFPPSGNYLDNIQCRWRIVTPSLDQYIVLTVLWTDMNNSTISGNDGFQIMTMNGQDNAGFSASSNQPTTYIFHSNMIYLMFSSDNAITGTGFYLNYTFQTASDQCASVATANDFGGSLKFPPSGNYPENVNCYWTLSFPDKRQYIMLTVLWTDINNSTDCGNDNFHIETERSYQSICNSRQEATTYTFHVSSLSLYFYSDSSITGNGFYLNYTFLPDPCTVASSADANGGWMQFPPSGNYLNNIFCSWTIDSPGFDKYIQLTMVWIDINNNTGCSGDNLGIELYQQDSQSFCTAQQNVFHTFNGNELFLTFESDDSNTGTGFFLNYTFQSATSVCNTTSLMTASGGSLKFPVSGNYSAGSSCRWQIPSPVNQNSVLVITLQWIDLFFTSSTACNDYLEIDAYVGSNNFYMFNPFMSYMTVDSIYMEICQSQQQTVTYTFPSKYHVILLFNTDNAVNTAGAGFYLNYTYQPVNWAWSAWSPCSVSCGGGVQSRNRSCTAAGSNCYLPYPTTDQLACNTIECSLMTTAAPTTVATTVAPTTVTTTAASTTVTTTAAASTTMTADPTTVTTTAASTISTTDPTTSVSSTTHSATGSQAITTPQTQQTTTTPPIISICIANDQGINIGFNDSISIWTHINAKTTTLQQSSSSLTQTARNAIESSVTTLLKCLVQKLPSQLNAVDYSQINSTLIYLSTTCINFDLTTTMNIIDIFDMGKSSSSLQGTRKSIGAISADKVFGSCASPSVPVALLAVKLQEVVDDMIKDIPPGGSLTIKTADVQIDILPPGKAEVKSAGGTQISLPDIPGVSLQVKASTSNPFPNAAHAEGIIGPMISIGPVGTGEVKCDVAFTIQIPVPMQFVPANNSVVAQKNSNSDSHQKPIVYKYTKLTPVSAAQR